MCHICESQDCGMRDLLNEVLRTGMTYAEIWNEYRAEHEALQEQYKQQARLAVRVKSLMEVFPDILMLNDAEQKNAEANQADDSEGFWSGENWDEGGEDSDAEVELMLHLVLGHHRWSEINPSAAHRLRLLITKMCFQCNNGECKLRETLQRPSATHNYVYAVHALEEIRAARTRLEMENGEEEIRIERYKKCIKEHRMRNESDHGRKAEPDAAEFMEAEEQWRKMRAIRKKREEEESNLRDEIEYYKKMVRQHLNAKRVTD
ncbi:hypothetical protein BD626DRAFT_576207 [Schizophyllum amplum]|uniref:Uncharacterized protein n=2 Tax=Schizophyllum amplum TaxID=97359 RepID=A0A550BU23_9AGAR|nr:hypothetical protein BD626DRAFT_576207 [Auriculariopsis ampla]